MKNIFYFLLGLIVFPIANIFASIFVNMVLQLFSGVIDAIKPAQIWLGFILPPIILLVILFILSQYFIGKSEFYNFRYFWISGAVVGWLIINGLILKNLTV